MKVRTRARDSLIGRLVASLVVLALFAIVAIYVGAYWVVPRLGNGYGR